MELRPSVRIREGRVPLLVAQRGRESYGGWEHRRWVSLAPLPLQRPSERPCHERIEPTLPALALTVHGNYDPRDYSDPGYAWLGELLASSRFILVSVDMNFLNGSIRQENDARGWMLLKHLEASFRSLHGRSRLPPCLPLPGGRLDFL